MAIAEKVLETMVWGFGYFWNELGDYGTRKGSMKKFGGGLCHIGGSWFKKKKLFFALILKNNTYVKDTYTYANELCWNIALWWLFRFVLFVVGNAVRPRALWQLIVIFVNMGVSVVSLKLPNNLTLYWFLSIRTRAISTRVNLLRWAIGTSDSSSLSPPLALLLIVSCCNHIFH